MKRVNHPPGGLNASGRNFPRFHLGAGLLCLLFYLCSSAPAFAAEAPTARIRVLLLENAKSAAVRGLDLVARDAETELELPLGAPAGSLTLNFSAAGGVLRIDGRAIKNRRLLIESPSEYLQLNEREYRSPLEVRAEGDQLQVINHLDLEQYLASTVAGEMPASWPIEALKAQAVVARSYAWRQIERSKMRGYDVVSDVRDQVYPGSDADRLPTVQAVRKTEGVVLVKDGKVVESFYHSTCGGATELASNVWPDRSEDLKPVNCTYCRLSPSSRWVFEMGAGELASKLTEAGFDEEAVKVFEVERRSPSGRALRIRVAGEKTSIAIDGNTLRRLVGYERIKSARFVSRFEDGRLRLEGEGFGHGVGMCQWGARGMALKGRRAEQILEFYYPGVQRGRLIGVIGQKEGTGLEGVGRP